MAFSKKYCGSFPGKRTAPFLKTLFSEKKFRLSKICRLGMPGVSSASALNTAKPLVKETIDRAETKTATDVHGNNNNSQKLQIVYEIYGLDAWETKTVFKYGVSGQKNYKTKWGNPLPKQFN